MAFRSLRPLNPTLLACFVISVGILECVDINPGTPDLGRRLLSLDLDDICTPTIWSPHPPPARANLDLTVPTTQRVTRTDDFLIHLFVPYGGPSGTKLSGLSRVTAIVDGRTGFLGLAFSYDVGSEDLYGRRTVLDPKGSIRHCVEQSFAINGNEGERIVGFEIRFAMKPQLSNRTIDSIKVGVFFSLFFLMSSQHMFHMRSSALPLSYDSDD